MNRLPIHNMQRKLLAQMQYESGQQINNAAAARSRATTWSSVRPPRCVDVFINHRGVDTKRTVVTLLYDQLARLQLRPFLDNKNMKPGDKLFDNINRAIRQCKVGVAVFSPRYCQSYFCLHELALMMESGKKVIPIFCDVKPSQLRVVSSPSGGGRHGTMSLFSKEEVRRFSLALEQAKCTVGLDFDSTKGNWSDVVTNATEIVIDSLIEIENEKQMVVGRN